VAPRGKGKACARSISTYVEVLPGKAEERGDGPRGRGSFFPETRSAQTGSPFQVKKRGGEGKETSREPHQKTSGGKKFGRCARNRHHPRELKTVKKKDQKKPVCHGWGKSVGGTTIAAKKGIDHKVLIKLSEGASGVRGQNGGGGQEAASFTRRLRQRPRE